MARFFSSSCGQVKRDFMASLHHHFYLLVEVDAEGIKFVMKKLGKEQHRYCAVKL